MLSEVKQMAMSILERRKGQLKRAMSKDIVRWWRYCGGQFIVCGQQYINGLGVQWELIHKFTSLKALIDTEGQYGIPNLIQEFTGEDAFEESLDWLVEKILETSDALQQRMLPYVEGKLRYEKALRGE